MKKHVITLGALGLLSSSAFAFTHVTGNITTNTTWTAANSPYILEGQIFVKGATLDIEPGTIIRGQPQSAPGAADAGALIVRPDAKIQARGTLAAPIIFTTAALDSGLASGAAASGVAKDSDANTLADRWSPADGDTKYLDLTPATSPLAPLNPLGAKNTSMWGGIVIAGDSLTNSGGQTLADGTAALPGNAAADGYGYIEGITAGPDAVYGGFNSEHNGGSLKYVSIRHGGALLSTGKELNGLTLYAVGSKTTISYVDIYATGDDGVEIFGGTVNLDHLNLNYCDDDALDIDEGYQGLVQYVFVLQGFGYGDNGLELDGEDKLEGNTVATVLFPVGDARIYNVTALLSTDAGVSASGSSVNGARMRAGFAGQIVNSIFQNYAATAAGQGLRVDGLKTTSLGAGEVAEYAPSSRDHLASGLLQVRNTTASGFTTLYTSVTGGAITQSTSGAYAGTFGGSAIPNVFYPSNGNRTLSTSIPTPNHTVAFGVDPRPSLAASALAYASTQDQNYVVSPAAVTAYKGAFDRTAASLWTTGWTALNKRGVLKN